MLIEGQTHWFDVTEDPKPGQLKDLGEALDDELVEVKDTAVEEVLERRESEADDLSLVVVVENISLKRASTQCSLGEISTFVKD